MSEIKISKPVVTKNIKKFARNIRHMDDKHLPEVMLELQAEEAALLNKVDHKSIRRFSRRVLQKVFHCWFLIGKGESWFNNMKVEERKFREQKKNLRTNKG